MRVNLGNEPDLEEFASVLLHVGNGSLINESGVIVIPPSLGTIVTSQQNHIDSVYPGIEGILNMDSGWLCNKAILAPTNEQANELNIKVMSLFTSEEQTYTSVNTVLSQDDAVHYPTEFIDSVTAPGLPAHELTLKVGAPIMLLRNLYPPKLCNGTRLRVRRLHRYVIEADILTGCGAGEVVFIPRIPLIPSNYPFEFKRLQFPVMLCYDHQQSSGSDTVDSWR
ncbi:uncharacterized protein LOC128993021 [Macrosteles quadrilineatus]|uniref:uncharacterized protein LOC128993021 n=1 Tax=Macrosteles quadrilineatus TaxID=74068 RepID=UPI0023E27A28|nr:uncharacterized protein LOC128993021 [Macrosteles quadrilineatus]